MATQHAPRPATTKSSTDAEGGGELKNGTADDSSDDSSANNNNMVNKGARSTTPGPNTNNVDAFQDGGQTTANSSRPPNMDYHYQQQNFNNNNQQEDFNNSEYRPPGYEHDQKLYPPQQYSNQMRPPFSPRAQPRYPARFVSGPSVSQQTGPTPTLNQLLQAPNSMQRYHNNYEYPNQQPKGDQQQQHYPNNQWGRGYPQQQQMYRNQGDVKQQQQRSYQMSSPGGQPYPQQAPYPPYPQGPRHNYPPQQQQQQQGGPQQHPSGTPQQHGPSGYDGQRPPMANYSPANVPPPQPTPTPPSQQQPPPPQQQQQSQPPPPQSQPQQQPPPEVGCDEGGEGGVRTTPPGVSPHRPPSGSPSPSMSPALGQPMPPRPSSTQSENSGQGPPATPQGYTPQPMAPPGMYGVNKMHQNMMPPSSHYPPQSGGYHRPPGSMSMHNYGSQNSSYPPSGPPYPPGGGQRMPSAAAAGGYPSSNAGAPYNQPPYPGAGASYGGMPPPNHYPKASMPPPPAAAAGAQAAAQAAVIAAAASSGGTVRQSPMYLRQHLQQKMYNSYGPDMPPPSNASDGAPSTIGPPTATTSSPSAVTASSPSEMMQSPRNSMGPPPLMDEGSQASNASASSSLPEDNRVETPKPATMSKQPMMSHPLPSPGAASMSSFHDDLESVSSPSWPRTPASPVINNQPYDHHPIKRPDGLLKLYDMSDEVERRLFLDKLIVYQEERGTPLSQCPTISKQPLDLYRLYMAAKERGGFVEVMKGKMWKEIAGLVGIGASSSAAYTLRKQYIKHLLPFECKFDRGGIDPVPLISSLESSSRKKAKNQGGPMMDGYPGPYPGGGGGGGYPHPGMEYPGGHHPPYPTDSGPPMHPHPNHSSEGAMDPFSDDIQQQQPYPPQTQRHNSSSEGGYAYPPAAGPPYGGGATSTSFGGGGYGGGGSQEPPYSGEQYPPDGGYGSRDPYAPPPGGYPPNRTVGPASQYPPYQNPCGDQERFAEPQPATPSPMLRPSTPTSSVIGPQQEPPLFPRYPSQPMGAREPPQPMGAYPGGRPTPAPSQYPPNNSQTSASPGQYTQTDAYNRGEFQPQMSRLQSTLIQRLLPKNQSPQQNYPPSQQQPPPQQGGYGGGMPPPNKVAPPGTIPPAMYQRGDMYQKRHPDYPPKDPYHYPLQTPSQPPYTDRNQYQYRPTHGMPPQSAGPPPSPQQGWPRDGRSYGGQYPQQRDTWGESPSHPPWAPRYGGPPQAEQPPYMGGPKMMSRAFPHNKMTPHGGSGASAPPQYASQQQQQRHREVHFPPDCVESTLPLLLGKRRRRLVSRDLPPVDPWRLMMSLKSGLLGEGTWALDVLNVLLHDDATVLYFGLAHMPGLLEVVVEHYRRCLWLVFGMRREAEVGYCEEEEDERRGKTTNSTDGTTEDKWWELDSDRRSKNDSASAPTVPTQNGERTQLLTDTTNYTHRTRCRKTVKTEEESEVPLFLLERKWDVFEGHASDGGHWARGGGEWTGHIQTHFEDDEKRVRFCRVLEDTRRSGPEDEDGSDRKTPCLDDGDSKGKCDEKNSSTDIVNSEPEGAPENGERTCETTDGAADGDFPKMRESCKRRAEEDLEEESYTRDEPSLCTVTDAQDSLSRRCIAVSSILRNLSFVPGNDAEMSKHSGFLLVLGRLLLLHHTHSPRRPPQRHYDQRDDDAPSTAAIASDSCSSLNGEGEWWWETLHVVRENTLVTLANVCGQLDLAPFPEEISFPLLDGLMHWVTCPSSSARDPLPTLPPHSVLSPQRLSLEALSKLSVLESNVDLMMALPPWERTSRLLSLLARWLARNEDQVLREFSVVLLSNLAQADSAVARAIALQPPCVPLLITFVEQAEQSALAVANAQGIGALRDNPELMGTTLDMVRRAAGTLRCLARVPANRVLFMRHQQRLLALVMSQILDQGVASIVADVLYECSSGDSDESH